MKFRAGGEEDDRDVMQERIAFKGSANLVPIDSFMMMSRRIRSGRGGCLMLFSAAEPLVAMRM
jgi:hypothetical protein